MEEVTVVLRGEPVAWARARLGKRGVPFTPPAQRVNATTLKILAQQEMRGRPPFAGPIRFSLIAEFPIPKTFSKAKRAAAIARTLRPTKKPDLSNLVKQAEDALNQVAFVDDANIVEYGTIQKVYSETPQVTITVTPLPRPDQG